MFDVLIVGGGMVGASLAVALKPLALNVGVVEAYTLKSSQQPSYDDRTVALSQGSRLIYQGMGIWDTLEPQLESIQHIHVSDRGHFGATRIDAAREKVPALGYVVENRVLGQVLYNALPHDHLTLFMPAKVMSVKPNTDDVEVQIHQQGELKTLKTRLLIVADGSQSNMREQLGVGVTRREYGQSAVIANVSTEIPHDHIAYERFTSTGPLALLPLTQQRYSLVWTHPSDNIAEVMSWSDAEFLVQLQAAFGYRQGRFTQVGKRSSYPLSLIKSTREIAARSVVLGNASHAIHPVAGQGLNLSLRDVAVLADLLAGAVRDGADVGALSLLERYEQQRQGDYRTTITYTDGLVHIFSNDFWLLGHMRAGGLTMMDRVPPLRRWLTRQSMGLNQRQARLARGVELRI